MKDEFIYIESIQENIGYIFDFIKGFSYDLYVLDTKTKFAVERSLENIGEAVKNISTQTKNQISDSIPWKEIAGMRDILVHHYLSIDDDIVWDVIINKLPDLYELTENYLENIKN